MSQAKSYATCAELALRGTIEKIGLGKYRFRQAPFPELITFCEKMRVITLKVLMDEFLVDESFAKAYVSKLIDAKYLVEGKQGDEWHYAYSPRLTKPIPIAVSEPEEEPELPQPKKGLPPASEWKIALFKSTCDDCLKEFNKLNVHPKKDVKYCNDCFKKNVPKEK